MLCKKVGNEFTKLNYEYEHIVIDNNSTDNTVTILRDICKNDKNVKVIVNNKNYGHITSPYYAMLQSSGDATILINADFQDPVELIPELIKKWKRIKSNFITKKTYKKKIIIN